MNELKDYTTMSFDEALTLSSDEFDKWCKANPIKLNDAKKAIAGEVKGDLDESN
jgi:hypothetical protein